MLYRTLWSRTRLVRYTLIGFVMLIIGIMVVSPTRPLPCIPERDIITEGVSIHSCIADTHLEQTQGLSDSLYLPRSWGMLFVFEKPDRHAFWMPNMNYSIDIFWLDENYSVVAAWRNALPKTYPAVFQPRIPAKYVLETRPGVIPGEFPPAYSVKN